MTGLELLVGGGLVLGGRLAKREWLAHREYEARAEQRLLEIAEERRVQALKAEQRHRIQAVEQWGQQALWQVLVDQAGQQQLEPRR